MAIMRFFVLVFFVFSISMLSYGLINEGGTGWALMGGVLLFTSAICQLAIELGEYRTMRNKEISQYERAA